MVGQNRANGETVEKERRALELATDGLTFEAIAAELGYATPSGAWRAVQRGLRRTVQPAADEYRALHLRRLEGMFAALVPAIRNGDPKSIRAAVAVLAREAKLFGLDAPVKIDIGRLVDAVAQRHGLAPDERDVLFTDLTDYLAGQRAGVAP